MRTLIRHGVVLVSLSMFATLAACGGEDKPAQDPSAMAPPVPPEAPAAPMPESKPPTSDMKPAETAIGTDGNSITETTTAKPADKPLTDAEIVAVASTTNTSEIEMAELAKKNASNTEVKNYAAMMLTQHRDMENKGKAVASKAKITPADNDASSAIKSDAQSTISTLKSQKGKDFDKAYMESQVKAQREALSTFDNKLLPNAQNGDLKSLLTNERSRVATNLAKAQELQLKLETGIAPPGKPAKPALKPAPKD